MEEIPGEGRVAGTQFSHNGYGYVLSGDGDDHDSMDEGEFYKYDGLTNTWEELPPHPGRSRWAPASFVLDNEVYIINGMIDGVYQDETYKFLLEEPSNANDLVVNENIQVYPNPFSDNFKIELDEALINSNDDLSVKLYDLLGRLVLDTPVNSSFEITNLNHLESGSYLLELHSNSKTIGRSLLVKGN